jgi:hypothetical protein
MTSVIHPADPGPDTPRGPAAGVEPGPTAETGAPIGDAPAKRARGRRWWIGGIAIAALVVIVLAPLASSDPDGLERVAEDNGFIGQATNVVGGLLGGYTVPGVDGGGVSTILAGLLGIAIVVGLLFLLGRVLARRRP